ncbi:acyl-CoA thioesterase [Frateuria aurantia]
MSSDSVNQLIGLLALERIEDNHFRGQSHDIGTRHVFGGQVLGQALSAAQQTVAAERAAHSLHAYFLRAGDIEAPILYNVERTRDGGSFSSRRVVAIQHGQPILHASVSFQIEEAGFQHQQAMPEVLRPAQLPERPNIDPEVLAKLPARYRRWFSSDAPFEFRLADPSFNPLSPEPRPPRQQIWLRLRHRIDATPELHRSLLAYASDFNLLMTSTLPHGVHLHTPKLQMASLDHALWFHRQPQLDAWLLCDFASPYSGGARGFARCQMYTEDGLLVASSAQEGLIRLRD